MLQEGEKAPLFESVDHNENVVSLSDYIGDKNIVLYFYPKDDTPSCTIQAMDFTKYSKEFAEQDAVVIGISKDSCDSHRAFIDKYGLNVELLADTTGEVCALYDVWKEIEFNGMKFMGVERSNFVINKEGVLIKAQYNVPPEGNAEVLLDVIKAL